MQAVKTRWAVLALVGALGILALSLVAYGDGAALLMNGLGEEARGLVVVFSEDVEITSFTGPFVAQSPLGKSAEFSFSLGEVQPGDGFFILWIPASASILEHEWLVDTTVPEHALEPDLAGRLVFNGVPLSELTAVKPTAWYYDKTAGDYHTDAVLHYDEDTGDYRIYGLPPHLMAMNFDFDVNQDGGRTGGDYRVQGHEVDLEALSVKERASYDLPVSIITHLRKPVDNGSEVDAAYENLVLASPVRVEWDAVLGATSYSVEFALHRGADHPAGIGFIQYVMDLRTDQTSLLAYLLGNEDHEHYSLNIRAFNAQGMTISYLIVDWPRSYAWRYDFTVAK